MYNAWMLRATSLCASLAALPVLLGCTGVSRHARAGGEVATMTVRAVDWNPEHAAVGKVDAVADVGSDVVVFSDVGATVLSEGAIVAVDHSASRWSFATSIAAADGNGSWIVGLDDRGRVLRLRGRSVMEPVSERWALSREPVHALVSLDEGVIGFALDGGLAIADGKTITRFDLGNVGALSGGGGRGAVLLDGEVRTFDVSMKEARSFALPGVQRIAVDRRGHLYAATSHELYADDGIGTLMLRYVAEGSELHGLVASNGRVWFADGGELGTFDPAGSGQGDDVVSITNGLSLAKTARLSASMSSGDVWALDGGALLRFANGASSPSSAGATAREQLWTSGIRPIFFRACASCHVAGGSAGVDLSTFTAWEQRRATVQRKVLDERTMPPSGHALSDADRAAIAAWVK